MIHFVRQISSLYICGDPYFYRTELLGIRIPLRYLVLDCCGSGVTNPTSIHEELSSISGPAQRVKDPVLAVSYDVGHRGGSGLALLWL